MSDSPETIFSRRLSEDEAHQVLARAAELDARRPTTLSVEQLWSSAAEAGISREAFAQATAELRAGKLGPKPVRGALASAVTNLSRVTVAAVLVYAAIVDPNRPVAQLLGLACAVFGAYVGIGSITSWIAGQRRKRHAAQASQVSGAGSEKNGTHISLAVRVLALQGPRMS